MWRELTLVVSLLAALATPAQAQDPKCAQPLTEPEFIDALQRAWATLDNEQNLPPEAMFREFRVSIEAIEARLPCADYLFDPTQLARLYVGIAFIRFADESDTTESYKPYMDAALYIAPRLTLPGSPNHPLHRYVPPPQPAPTNIPMPEGTRLYWNGELAKFVPPTTTVAVAQRRDASGYSTILLQPGESIPPSWLHEPSLLVMKGRYEVYAGLGGTVGVTSMPAADEDDFYGGRKALALSPVLHADAKATPGIPLGVQARAWLPVLDPRRGGALDLGLFWRADLIDIHIGASARGLEAAGAFRQLAIGLGGHLGAELHAGDARLGVIGGIGPGWGGFETFVVQALGPVHIGGWLALLRSGWTDERAGTSVPATSTLGGISVGLGRRK